MIERFYGRNITAVGLENDEVLDGIRDGVYSVIRSYYIEDDDEFGGYRHHSRYPEFKDEDIRKLCNSLVKDSLGDAEILWLEPPRDADGKEIRVSEKDTLLSYIAADINEYYVNVEGYMYYMYTPESLINSAMHGTLHDKLVEAIRDYVEGAILNSSCTIGYSVFLS